MPTINQLVKNKRKKVTKKSKAVALARGFNAIKNKPVFYKIRFFHLVFTNITCIFSV